jgi:hypothetical protein
VLTAVHVRSFARRRSRLQSGCPRCQRCWPERLQHATFYHPVNQAGRCRGSRLQVAFMAQYWCHNAGFNTPRVSYITVTIPPLQ